MRALISDSIADRRFIVTLLAVTAALALLMSAAGVYGVVSHATSRRISEIGVRIALGASPSSVHLLIFRQGFSAVFLVCLPKIPSNPQTLALTRTIH